MDCPRAVEGLFFCLFLGTLSGMAELGLPHWILRYLWGQWKLSLKGTGLRSVGFLVQALVTDQNWKVVLVAAEVPGDLQSTVKVALEQFTEC